jgi:acyl-coenzyme A synthetase/AMP-(fatty) acid ligase
VRSPYVSPSPAAAPDGFFRTADLVELRPDGRFDLLGRSDGIVKVGGQRVALASIEQELLALDGVLDAAALALPSPSGRGHEIVALVASTRDAADLGRELRQRVPSPSWPRRIRCVPALPVTPSGKRDREAMLKLLEVDEGEAAPA